MYVYCDTYLKINAIINCDALWFFQNILSIEIDLSVDDDRYIWPSICIIWTWSKDKFSLIHDVLRFVFLSEKNSIIKNNKQDV